MIELLAERKAPGHVPPTLLSAKQPAISLFIIPLLTMALAELVADALIAASIVIFPFFYLLAAIWKVDVLPLYHYTSLMLWLWMVGPMMAGAGKHGEVVFRWHLIGCSMELMAVM